MADRCPVAVIDVKGRHGHTVGKGGTDLGGLCAGEPYGRRAISEKRRGYGSCGFRATGSETGGSGTDRVEDTVLGHSQGYFRDIFAGKFGDEFGQSVDGGHVLPCSRFLQIKIIRVALKSTRLARISS